MMEILLGLLIMVGLPGLGFWLGCVRTNRKHALAHQEAICESCDDAFGHHDPRSGRCLAEHHRKMWHEGRGCEVAQWVQCTCQTYVGPVPLDTIGLLNTPLPERSTTEEENPR